jgi:hypothetical protein
MSAICTMVIGFRWASRDRGILLPQDNLVRDGSKSSVAVDGLI